VHEVQDATDSGRGRIKVHEADLFVVVAVAAARGGPSRRIAYLGLLR
jgi:hypothetical protein